MLSLVRGEVDDRMELWGLYEYQSKPPSRREPCSLYRPHDHWDSKFFAKPLLILQHTSLPQGLPMIKI